MHSVCADTPLVCQTIVFLCCCRGVCAMAGMGAVPSDEALETVTLQAYRDYSKSSAQSISKTEFSDWVIKFASGAHNDGAASAKEVSLQAAMETFGVVSTPSQHNPTAGSDTNGDENNHQAYEHDVTTDAAAVDPDDVSFAQDDAYKSVSGGDYAVEAELFDPAEQHDEPAEHFGHQQQQIEEVHGSSGHEQVEDDSSRDAYYDEEYDAGVEDAGGSAEHHDLPIDHHDHDPPIEDQPSDDHELVAAVETQDVSDYPASSPDDGAQDQDVDPPMDLDTVPTVPSRPLSAAPAEMDAESDGETLHVADSADRLESDAVVQSVEDASIAIEGELVADDQPELLAANAHESHSHEDAYDDEFAHEESTEEESHPARREEDDIGEYTVEYQEGTAEARADSVGPPAEDAGGTEAEPAGAGEDQDLEAAPLHENAAGDSVEPPQVEPMEAADHATVEDSNHEQEEGGGRHEEEAYEQDAEQQQDSGAEEQSPRDGDVDLNAFDTYDYEDAAYDGSSGLAPPDPNGEDEDEAPTPLESDQAAEPASTSTPDEPAS